MTESEIRNSLVSKLKSTKSGLGAAFISEMFVDGFSRRADLVMANGRLAAFEIKSDRDSLDRLCGQLESYCRLFEQVTVVCARKHLAGVLAISPESVGVWVVDSSCQLTVIRRTKTKIVNSFESWLSFLPVDELRKMLRSYGLAQSGGREELIARAKGLQLSSVRTYVLEYLKRRNDRIVRLVARRSARRAQRRSLVQRSEPNLESFEMQPISSLAAIPRTFTYSSKPSSRSSS